MLADLSRGKCYNVLTNFIFRRILMAVIKIQTGLRIDETTYGKLKTLSAKEGRTLNNLIDYIIHLYLQDYEEKHGVLPEFQD